jgi:hypothetical protein
VIIDTATSAAGLSLSKRLVREAIEPELIELVDNNLGVYGVHDRACLNRLDGCTHTDATGHAMLLENGARVGMLLERLNDQHFLVEQRHLTSKPTAKHENDRRDVCFVGAAVAYFRPGT